jgi:tetratricopeptide (TPR) repeat protein
MVGRGQCWLLSVCVLLGSCIGPAFAAQKADEAAVERYSRQAEQALEEKNLDQAVAALEKLAELTPDVPEVQGNLGMVYYAQGRFAQASEAFQRALKLNPRMTRAELMSGVCFSELGRHQEAVRILQPAFLDPPDKDFGRLVGLELLRAYTGLKQYAKADATSHELLDRYPDDAEILYHAAHLHADESFNLTLRLIDVAPSSVWVRLSSAEVHESLGNCGLAIIEYRAILEKEPRLPGVHFRLGRCLLASSKEEKAEAEAIAEFEHELAIDPQNSNAAYEIGEIYRKEGHLEQALDYFSRAIHYHPEFEEAQIALGRSLATLGKMQEALPHLLAAVRENPSNEVGHYQLARVYKALGDRESHQKHLALFRKLHATSLKGRVSVGLQRALAAPEVTKQTLDSDPSSE